MNYLRGIIGLFFILGIAYLLSGNKKKINWKLVSIGMLFQIIIGLCIAKVSIIRSIFEFASEKFVIFLGFAREGSRFIFGSLANDTSSTGFIFAFQALPTVIFFSAVTAGLYYLGILQKIVYGFAWLMTRSMKLSGSESLSAAANIFMGQTEAPLLVRPFISKMTQSELFCLMVGGMATIAGSVLATYVGLLGGGSLQEKTLFATYLLCASIMNAPAAIVLSKIIYPQDQPERIDSAIRVNKEQIGVNLIDAIATGAGDGIKLAINIGGMLLAFIAIIYSLNWILSGFIGEITFGGNFIGLNEYVNKSTNGTFHAFTMQYILGQIFRIFAFAMGVEWSQTLAIGSLLGQKMVINEFVAYVDLSKMKALGILDTKSIRIATYALCGFANFSSIAIQIAGIGGMAPNRQGDLSRLGLRAMIAASLATMMTATIAGAIF